MSTAGNDSTQVEKRAPRSGRLAVVLALLALAGTAVQWFGGTARDAAGSERAEEIAKAQRRLNALETRLQRERDDLDRILQRIGAADSVGDPLVGRIARLEDAMAKQPGGEQVRRRWLVEQAEYYMRVANAQENLVGNSAGALTALMIADEHLRDAADPRLTSVRRLLADEITALRAVPKVDTEGLALKLAALAGTIGRVPTRLAATTAFEPQPQAPAVAAGGTERAVEALRNAFTSIVSVRRTDAPSATLLTEESAALLLRSLELELQMARLALLRGEAQVYRASLASLRRQLEQYFDVGSPEGAAALATLEDLAATPLPDALPDISASLAELLRVKAREPGP